MSRTMNEITWLPMVLLSVAVLPLSAAAQTARAALPADGAQAAASPGAAALDQAARDNKYLFIFFYAASDAHTAAMNSVFRTAMAKMADRADATTIHVADPAEKRIVDKFRVRGAPMPLVLAIAPVGVPTRAFPRRFEERQLEQAFVSPGTARCMKVIFDRRLCLICVQNGKTRFNEEAMQGVEAFKSDPQYAKVTEIVMLDPTDKAEQPFIRALEVDPATTTAVTLLVTPPGAPVATFHGAVTKEAIVAKLAAAQSSCCPDGNCGPGGCSPK